MLTNIDLRDFRCFERMAVELGPKLNVFLGANGEGKTTLLEAGCVLLRLQSQRSTSFLPLMQLGKNSFVLRGILDGHDLQVRYSRLHRTINFDGLEQRNPQEYLRLARVVSFANADIDLVRAGAEPRRRFIDFLGAQVDASYRPTLRAYERALRARNALLKSPTPRSREITAYDSLLIDHGSQLLKRRQRLAANISPLATAAYGRLSSGREELDLKFVAGVGEDFAAALEKSRDEEKRLKQTVVGPHRDDLELRIDGMPAAQFASEGQQRTIVLALKIAQAEAFTAIDAAKPPLLLIDDVFGELDSGRRNALLDNLPAASQKMLTATALPWRAEIDADKVYALQDRQLILVANK